MQKKETKFRFLNKATVQIVAILLIVLTAAILLWQGNKNSNQAIPVTSAQVYFVGEYKIGDGDWQEYVAGEHIPATKGDVTLRGNLHMLKPNGEYWGVFTGGSPIAFYANHINLTFYEVNRNPYSIDNENPRIGVSACGENWTAMNL